MTTALIHLQAGLLSAYGIGLAPIRALHEAGLERAFDAAGLKAARGLLDTLSDQARASVADQGATTFVCELNCACGPPGPTPRSRFQPVTRTISAPPLARRTGACSVLRRRLTPR